ncbi:unnamed protein product, partial [Chrysoparadoxa australica]
VADAWHGKSRDPFFTSFPAPHLDVNSQKNASRGRPVVCVTSGGTTVPLERNTVRSIDNFSTGRRGALSAESFLSLGYAVIYVHREGCCVPYARAVSDATSKHFDLEYMSCLQTRREGGIDLSPKQGGRRSPLPDTLHQCQHDPTKLLTVASLPPSMSPLLACRCVSLDLSQLGRHAMLYLAAAVSDFYIPSDQLSCHKIQSEGGALTLQLEGVPKCLGMVRSVWCQDAFCVSFKLETDESLLQSKARGAIEKY